MQYKTLLKPKCQRFKPHENSAVALALLQGHSSQPWGSYAAGGYPNGLEGKWDRGSREQSSLVDAGLESQRLQLWPALLLLLQTAVSINQTFIRSWLE